MKDKDSLKITAIYTSRIFVLVHGKSFPKQFKAGVWKKNIHEPAPKFISSSIPQLLSIPIQISLLQSVRQVLTQFHPNVPDIQPLDIDLPTPQISIDSSNYQIDNKYTQSDSSFSTVCTQPEPI